MVEGNTTRKRILKLELTRIEVEVKGRPSLQLDVLSIKDVDDLRVKLDLRSVEFAVQVLVHQSRGEVDTTALRRLPRPTLLRIARTWACHPGTLAAESSKIRKFVDFRTLARRRLDEWDRQAIGLARRLRRAMAPVVVSSQISAGIRQQMRKIEVASRSLQALSQTATEINESIAKSFTASLPDWEQIRQAFREADHGKDHLDDIGYGFVVGDWGIPALRRIARDRPDSREVHRAFLEFTRETHFGEELLQRLAGSQTLRRREPILRSAYAAHMSRDYALTVPVFYAQLEGVLTDLLIVEGLARRRGRRAVRRTGAELRGLGPKAMQYGKGESTVRKFVTREILEDLVPERNGVLHGSKTWYRQARRSARLLLLIDVLTKIVVTLEGSVRGGLTSVCC